MNWPEAMERLKRHEGRVVDDDGNHLAYDDADGQPVMAPQGHMTLGYGWNLQERGVPEEVADLLLKIAMATAEDDAQSLFIHYAHFNECRQEVLMQMAFNLGRSRLKRFSRMIAALENWDFVGAATEMRHSRWYRQVGRRAEELAAGMEIGAWGSDFKV